MVIGDIHGSLAGLVTLLQETGLVDAQGEPAHAPPTKLVIAGDFVGKGFDSLGTLAYLNYLQIHHTDLEVSVVAGNTEIKALRRDFSSFTSRDLRHAIPFDPGDPGPPPSPFYQKPLSRAERRFISAMLHPGLRPFLLGMSLFEKAGPFFIVHAGLPAGISDSEIALFNDQFQEWLRFFLHLGELPPRETAWVWGPMGPAETRDTAKRITPPETVHRLLQNLEAEYLILGHSPTATGKITKMPYYGNRVIKVDTSMYKLFGKNPPKKAAMQALMFEDGHLLTSPRLTAPTIKRSSLEALRERACTFSFGTNY